jgi:hypothetical protein
MTHWRKLTNRELVREHLIPFADQAEPQTERAIKEAARRLMLPKMRREKPPERRPHVRRDM